MDILDDCGEDSAEVSFDGAVKLDLKSKVRDGKLYVDQGIIAGCAGGGFENICDAADILKGKSIGADEFTLSVYPASTPVYMELVKNGAVACSDGDRSDRKDCVLRTMLRRRRYTGKQRVFHPPFHQELPEP